jgi:hypothetical protein
LVKTTIKSERRKPDDFGLQIFDCSRSDNKICNPRSANLLIG